jgi:hypothetical protein
MCGRERECWHTNGYVLGTFVLRCAIAHPFATLDHDGLSSGNFNHPRPMLDAQQAREHDGIFIEFGRLPWLDPAAWAAHVCNAQPGVARIHAAHVLINELGLVARRLDPSWLCKQSRHDLSWHARSRNRHESSDANGAIPRGQCPSTSRAHN